MCVKNLFFCPKLDEWMLGKYLGVQFLWRAENSSNY